jgi:2-keto-myo-inositol isomerase
MSQSTPPSTSSPFEFCLNTSTIRGAQLPLSREIEIAAAAGYRAVEPWIEEIERHLGSGGSLADLRRKIEDLGLSVAGAVGFAQWIIDDPQQRAAGLERMKHDMELVAGIGGRHIACPPIGAHESGHARPQLDVIAERYRALLDLGRQTGVTPVLELWGFSQTLSKLSELLYVAAATADLDTRLLLDSYHLHKGGSGFTGVSLVNGAMLPVFHINDYPASPPRAQIDDSDRIYPGDGVAPLNVLFQTLLSIGFRGFLSVELFNREYWKRPAEVVAREGIEKTRAAVSRAIFGNADGR